MVAIGANLNRLEKTMNAHITEAITNADAHLNNVALPNYTDFVAAAKLALRAIDSRISANGGEVSDDEVFAYEALCRVLVSDLTGDE